MVRRQKSTTRLYDADVSEPTQQRALTDGEVPGAVYGLGKMGLPLAAVLADVTENITGVDIDPEVVETIAAGECPVQGEPGLSGLLDSVIEDGRFEATTDAAAAAAEAHLHVVIVPTVLDGEKPDLSALQAAVEVIGNGLDSGDFVVVESTVPPGTCRDVVEPELAERSGLDPEEFGLAFCPERTASGRALQDIRGSYPKVVGGRDEESTRVASLLYEEVTDNEVVPVTDCLTAECVKLFEGLYRDVNIALANELAKLGDDLGFDANEAMTVASMPSYCDIHSPGPGVGGHCIPYYPYFVFDSASRETPLLRTARKTNEGMPGYTVSLLEDALEANGVDLDGATVALLGITYRAGVDEVRAAPAFPIASMLSEAGANVYAADPVCSDAEELTAERVTIDLVPALDPDAAVIVTAHEEFRTIGWDQMEDAIVLDGRQMFRDGELPQRVYHLGNGSRRPKTAEETT